jgi:Novel STAND NTPase 1
LRPLREIDRRASLQRELSAEPSAATRAAYEAALSASHKSHGDRSPAPRRNNNLPLQLTSFIGREREIARIKAVLAETRLLTLTGAGGSGKTRLALQVAGELAPTMADGVWLVELAPLSDSALVPLVVAKVLDVREEPGRTLTETLAEALIGKQLLLVLDNCDHVVTACAQLAEVLLHQRQRLRLLATLPGQPLYASVGFVAIEPVQLPMPGGLVLPAVPMTKHLGYIPNEREPERARSVTI